MRTSVKAMRFWIKCAASAAIAAWVLHRASALAELPLADLRSASGVVAQIGATMLGLILAALAVLLTVVNSRLVRNMQKTGHFRVLLQRMFATVGAFGATTIIGVSILFLPQVDVNFGYFLLGLAIFSVLLLADSTWKFWMVLHHLNPSS